MPTTIPPTTEISVTAVCVESATQSVTASPLLIDSDHFVFVTVQVVAGLSNPPVQTAWIRCALSGSGFVGEVRRSTSAMAIGSSLGRLRQDPNGGAGFSMAEVSRAVFPDYVGTHYFAIVASSGFATASSVFCELKQRGLRWNDGARHGLERPASLDLPSAIGLASVDLPDGTLVLRFPLFEEGDAAVSVPCVVTHRSPVGRCGALIPSGALGKCWRFSFEHTIVPSGDGYFYYDGDGFVREFRPAQVQGLQGRTLYFDVAKTGAVIVEEGASRTLLRPTLETIDFDADGNGIRVARPLNGSNSIEYEVVYANGLPTLVRTGSREWIALSYSSGAVTVSRRSGGSWVISSFSPIAGIKEVSSIAYPDGYAASIVYVASSDPSLVLFFVVSSVSYRGHALAVSRDSLFRVESAAFSRPSGLESEIHLSYGGPYVVVEERPFGLVAASSRWGYYFDASCECVAEYSVDDGGSCVSPVGYSLSDAAHGQMVAEGSSEAWEGGDVEVRTGHYELIDVENGAEIPPGSYLFMRLRAQSAWSRLSPAPYLIVQLCGSNDVLATRYAYAVGPDWVPWFLPIPKAAEGLVRSITLICPTPNSEVEVEGISIRFAQTGFAAQGWDASSPPSSGPELAGVADLRVYWGAGAQQESFSFADTTKRLLAASSLLSNALGGDDSVLLTESGAIAGESLEVTDFFGVLPRTPIKTIRTMLVCDGCVWQPSEPVPYWRATREVRTFGRRGPDLSAGYVEESSQTLCLPSGEVARNEASYRFYDQWLKLVASSDASGEDAVQYDSSGRVEEFQRKALCISHSGPSLNSARAVLQYRGYGDDGNQISELPSRYLGSSGERYVYSSGGRLESVATPGFLSLFPLSVNYESHEPTGVSWGKGAQMVQIRNRVAPDAQDPEKLSASVTVDSVAALSAEVNEAILSSGGIERSFSVGQGQAQWGVRIARHYSQLGLPIVDVTSLGSLPIESREFDRDGRLLRVSKGGATCAEISYGSSGWNRNLPVSVAFGNRAIALSYREDGRVSSISEGEGHPSARVGYTAVTREEGRAYEFVEARSYENACPLLAESIASGVSESTPWGYTLVDTTFCVGPGLVVSCSFAKTGPQSSPTRAFGDGVSILVESVGFDAEPDPSSAMETTVPKKSSFSIRASGSTILLVEEFYGKEAGSRINELTDASRHLRCACVRDLTSGEIVQETIELRSSTFSRSYAFDALGNPVRVIKDGVDRIRQYSPSGLLVSEFSGGQTVQFGHDSAGRMVTRGDASVSWSGWRILGISSLGTLGYDGDLLTSETPADGSRTYTLGYVFGKLRNEILSVGGQSRVRLDYFYGGDGLVSGFLSGGKAYFFRRNFLGDVVSIYGSNGAVAHYAYGAFSETFVLDADGEIDADPFSLGNVNPFRYRGMRFYRTLGVYQMGERVYDPSLMRFLTPDYPEYLDPMARYGLNPFCYCYNDPITYSDVTGHEAIAITIGVLLWILAGAGVIALAVSEPQTHLLTNTFGMLTEAIGDVFHALAYLAGTWGSSLFGNAWTDGKTTFSDSFDYSYPLFEIGPNVMFAKPWDVNARAGQKKQGREMKNKSRAKFKQKCKFRHGRKPLKHHTPGDDHRKYLWWLLFGVWRDWFDEVEEDEGFF